ncbi:MAG: hypothetical protein H6553_13140 [Chitinophagales bacterium]|nr:hypothetical protein [Chitinophagales bacterium]
MKSIKHIILIISCIFTITIGYSQTNNSYFPPIPKDTLQRKQIQIKQTDSLAYISDGFYKFRKLIGHVILKHEQATMWCDSALIDLNANYLTAYGKPVRINDADTVNIYGNFLEYFGDTKISRITGNAKLKDEETTITSDEFTYNLDTDIGFYRTGGKMVKDKTTLVSDIAYYYHRKHETFFYGNVVVLDDKRTIYTDSLRYNTEKEIIYFITKTKIVDEDSSVIYTDDGYYDTKKERLYLGKNAEIYKDDKIIKGNVVQYDKEKESALIKGNGMLIDTTENSTVLGNKIIYYEKDEYLLATEDPLIINVNDDNDTLYLSADTLISYSIINPTKNIIDTNLIVGDSTVVQQDSILIKKDTLAITSDSMMILNDTSIVLDNFTRTTPDSLKVMFAYKNVKMLQKEFSAVCDSMFYSEVDSIFKLYYHPIIWIDSTQITGDSIYIYTKDEELNHVTVFNNAFIINWIEGEIFNQIKGKNIEADIVDDKLKSVFVDANAESIYYIQDDDEAYIGNNKSTSGNIEIWFDEDDEVSRIKLTIAPEAVFTPMEKTTVTANRLEGFNWQWEKKPKTLFDIIRDRNQYENYLLKKDNKKEAATTTEIPHQESINYSKNNFDALQQEHQVTKPEKKGKFIKKEK